MGSSKFRKRYTDIELINILKDYYNEYNRTPRVSDFIGKIPSNNTFTVRFGSWDNALMSAGLENVNKNKIITNNGEVFDNAYLIDKLKEFYNIYNRVPSTAELNAKYGMPNSQTYYNRFGSYKNALIEAELYDKHNDKYFEQIHYSDEELLNMLYNFIEEHMICNDSLPTKNDIDNCEDLPCAGTYVVRFGGILKAFKLLGYDVVNYTDKSDEQLIEELVEVIKNYGRISVHKFTEYNLYPYCVYLNRFKINTYYDLLILAGFNDIAEDCKYISNDEVIEIYEDIKSNIGKIPTLEEIKAYTKVNNISTIASKIYNRWGGYAKFLKEVGDYNDRTIGIYYSDDGMQCFSRYEQIISNTLYCNNIPYIKDVFYRDFIKDFNKMYTVDYYLPTYNIYIEVFGMTGIDKYTERVKEKQDLFNNNNLELISIYPQDFIDNYYKMDKFISDKIFNIKTIEHEYRQCM